MAKLRAATWTWSWLCMTKRCGTTWRRRGERDEKDGWSRVGRHDSAWKGNMDMAGLGVVMWTWQCLAEIWMAARTSKYSEIFDQRE
jgi:hypothetical protein